MTEHMSQVLYAVVVEAWEESGLEPAEFSDAVGMEPGWFAEYQADPSKISLNAAHQVARHLSIDLGDVQQEAEIQANRTRRQLI